MKIEIKDNVLTAYISGELDHHSAKGIRTQIDTAIDINKPQKAVLDFSGVTFMDSSGIGLVMGRYKVMQMINGTVVVQNPPKNIKKVMQLAGLDRIASINSERIV